MCSFRLNGFHVVELQNSAQRRASANILELREISKCHSVEETEASSTSTLKAPTTGAKTWTLDSLIHTLAKK